MLLAGDIGGTKTTLAIYDPSKDPRHPVAEVTFRSNEYPSLETVVRDFLGQSHAQVKRATFGVAGPVLNGVAEITNLPWVMHETRLRDDLNFSSVRLINDLVAVAIGVPFLKDDEVYTIQAGSPEKTGTIGVIAPGTGLGEAFLTWSAKVYTAHASEGGHTDFAPATALQFGLLRYLQERFGHVSYERVCSGSGFPNLYHYLKDMGYAEEPPWLADRLKRAEDPTPIIVQAALDDKNPCELCQAALRLFVAILGSEAGNLALKLMATGGIYLGGGIPPRILPFLKQSLFLNAFLNKGRFAGLLAKIPVKVILNSKVALFGAACDVFRDPLS